MALTDEQLRAFVPRNYFLKEPYNAIVPEGEEKEEVTTSYGIPNTNAFTNSGGGGGGNYRTDYRPNYEYRKSLDYNPELSDLQNQKIMQNWKDYKGHDYYNPPEPTGVAKGINTVMNWMPYIGTMKKGAEFLGNTFGKYMPVNQRAIMENELRGSGVYTDDIGRIVAGSGGYNTPEGIMAGYNANKMTDKTFTGRQGDIRETLKDKYGLRDEQIDQLISGELTEDDFTGKKYQLPGGKISNLFSNIRNIELARLNYFDTKKKADDIYEWEKKQKELARHKDGDRMSDTQAEEYMKGKEVDQSQEFDGTPEPPGGQPGHGEGMDSGGWGDDYASEMIAEGGRVGYNRGRVGLRYGGLLSIL
jgi:hypothetical protein